MKYLSYEGLQYLAGQIKEYIESKVFKRNFESTSSEAKSASGDGVTYFTSDTKQIIKDGVAYGGSLATTQAGTASDQVAIKTVTEENVAFYPKTHVDAVEGILKHDFNSQSADIKNQNNDIVYFTTDSKQIIRNGVSYGGSITAEDVDVVQEGEITVQAVIFVQDCTTDSNSTFTIKPNLKYIFGQRGALTISLEPVIDSTIVNHYMFEFTSGSTATTLSLPASIKWTTEPSIKPNKTYQISIENNLGVIQEWT